MGITKCIIVTLAFLVLGTNAVPEYRRVVGHYGDAITAYEDVMIDEDAELITTTVIKVSSKKFTPSISFHDFSVGYNVIKLVEKGVCYIAKNTHSMEYVKDLLSSAERDNGNYDLTQIFKCTSKRFVEQSEMSTYGERIAAFCKDYESVFVEKEYKIRSKRSTLAVGQEALWCLVCFGNC